MLQLLAEAYQYAGRAEEGIAALDDGLNFAERTGERFYEAELRRLKGELLLSQALSTPPAERSVQTEAERWICDAMTVARRQNARSLELRAATSLCRLWQKHGKKAEARRTLAEVYDQFTDGSCLPDLEEAKQLLSELS